MLVHNVFVTPSSVSPASKGAVGFIICVMNINILILRIKNNPVDFDRVILQWKLVKIFT